MPYTAPTAAEFKTRFTVFASVTDPVVESALTEAASRVDETWLEADFVLGRMLYAAHVLTLDGQGTGPEAQDVAQGLAGVKSYRSGNFGVDRSGSANASGSVGSLSATSYGIRFAGLLRLNAPAIVVV